MKVSKKGMLRLCMLFMGIAFLGLGTVNAKAAQEEIICNGVYIDEISIGGMTKEEAKETVDAYIEKLMSKEIAVVLDEEVVITSIGDLGYSCNENTYIEEALNVGKVGNLIKRYKELKDVANGGLYYELEFQLDPTLVQEFIVTQCSIYDIPAQNATVQRSNGQFVYKQESIGRKLNVEATTNTIHDAILNDWNQLDIVVDATIEDDIPLYDLATVQKCNALLGSYTTNYSTSTTERKNNISNASKLIHNSIVYPGEIFSCYEKMSPFTTANGYYSAHAYVNGMVEDSIGGGVCQVSTTLYNAVLNAELEITQRAAHSMTVSYVPVSFDAAIAGTYKDLKFQNNLDVPVLIEAIANGTTITFNVYGFETRDTTNRRIEYKSEVISKTEPPKDVIKEDPTQPTTYRKVTQSAYTGYVAVLYKYVYENGKLVNTIQVNKSTYNASPAYVTVGTKVVEEVKPEEEEIEDNPTDEEESKEETSEDKKPTKPSKPTKPEDTTENEQESTDSVDDGLVQEPSKEEESTTEE